MTQLAPAGMATKMTLVLLILAFQISTISSQITIVNSEQIGAVKDIAISPNTEQIAVVGEKFVHLFRAADLYQTRTIRAIKRPSFSLFQSDHKILVASAKGTYQYDMRKNSIEVFSKNHYNAGHADPSSGQLFLVNDQSLDTYHKGKLEKSIPLRESGTAIRVSKNIIAVGYNSGQLDLFDRNSKELIRTSTAHKTKIVSLSIDASEKIVVSGATRDYRKGEFGEGIIWDFKQNRLLFRTVNNHKQVLSVGIHEQEAYIASLRDVHIYSFDGEKKRTIPSGQYSDPIFAIHQQKLILGIGDRGFTSDYLYEVTLNSSHSTRRFGQDARQIWDVAFHKNHLVLAKTGEFCSISATGEVLSSSIVSGSLIKVLKYPTQVYGIAKTKTTFPKKVISLDIEKNTLSSFLIPNNLLEERYSLNCLKHKDQDIALSRRCLWNITTGDTLVDFRSPPTRENFIKLAPPIRQFLATNQKLMFYEFDRENSVLHIRDGSTGNYLKEQQNVTQVINQDKDQLYYYSTTDSSIHALQLPTLTVEKTKKGIDTRSQKIQQVRKNADGSQIAILQGYAIQLYDLKSGQQYRMLSKGKTYLECIAFSPNNKYLLCGNRKGEVEIWDVSNGQFVGVIFSGSLKNDYVIVVGQAYDGTEAGINYLLNRKEGDSLTREEGLLSRLLFR